MDKLKLESALNHFDLNLIDYGVIFTILQLSLPRDELVEHVEWLYRESFLVRISHEQATAAIDTLQKRGLIQVLDGATANSINHNLDSSSALWPRRRQIKAGDIQFTQDGVDVFLALTHLAFGWSQDQFHIEYSETMKGEKKSETFIYATSKELAKEKIQKHFGRARRYGLRTFSAVSEPVPIGLFRDHWWRSPKEGYLIKAEYDFVDDETEDDQEE